MYGHGDRGGKLHFSNMAQNPRHNPHNFHRIKLNGLLRNNTTLPLPLTQLQTDLLLLILPSLPKRLSPSKLARGRDRNVLPIAHKFVLG